MLPVAKLLIGVCFFLYFNEFSADTINSDLNVQNVDRFIDLSTQLVKVSHKITLENNGKSAAHYFLFVVEPHIKSKVAFIGAQIADSSKGQLKVSEVNVQGHLDKQFWKVQLKDVLQPGKTVNVELETIVSAALDPYPKTITQKEKQFVRYFGNHYFYNPYFTSKQTTVVNVGTRNVESYSKLSPVAQSDTTFSYGPYEQVKPFSEDPLSVHYENNAPFLALTRLERVIEVSHWGNIAVEETLDVRHTGATLKGSFSRYDYQIESKSGASSVQSFKTILPAAATDVYYRDDIGNISTSHMRVMSDSVEMELRPRFPLYGGWKTHYILGYNVPTYEYLYYKDDNYKLKMRIVDHILDDMVVDEAVIKIILPEGAHSIKLSTPYPVQRLPDSKHFTYLDITGRPVITMTKNNIVENHILDFELSYVFPRVLMLQEPLILVVALYLLFLLVIIYVRLDFSITKDEVSESRLRVSGICEKLLLHQDRRAATYNHLENHLAKLKTNKDINAFLLAIKGINAEYKAESTHIIDLITKLKPDAPEVADKISDVQKLDKTMKDLFTQRQALYVDKLVPGKIGRTAFVESENALNKKKDECVEKINVIMKNIH